MRLIRKLQVARLAAWVPALIVVLLLVLPSADAKSFIYCSGNQLYHEGKPFYFFGFNQVTLGANVAYGIADNGPDMLMVDNILDGAQRLGLMVVRTWAFNEQFPNPNSRGLNLTYSETQARGLDYVIAGASKRNMRVVLALGNFWNHYFGPESWLTIAEGSAAGKTITDFYRSPAVGDVYRSHIHYVTGRVNSFTGIAYKDDPTIMAWNLLNEPRCPGCDSSAIAARDGFLSSLTASLKAAAPNQLTFSSTEGYFGPGDPNAAYNPGAGGQCEGEDWTKEAAYSDVASAHIYYRQLERLETTGWYRPDFNFYVNYLSFKMQLYTQLAGRPFVVEEFGLTRRLAGDEERKVVFAVVADALIAAKRAGSPLMGGMFWQGTNWRMPDVDGYNVDVTRTPSGRTVGLGKGAAATVAAFNNSSNGTTDSSSSTDDGSSSSSDRCKRTIPATTVAGRRMLGSYQAVAASDNNNARGQSSSSSSSSGGGGGWVRKLSEVSSGHGDYLDGFRQGPARDSCANAASWNGWKMGSFAKDAVDVEAYRALVRGHDIVDIIAEAVQLLSS